LNGIDALIGVFIVLKVGAGCNIFAPVNVFAIRGNNRLSGILLVVFTFG